MLTIGRFADATGLTVRALRHYDEIGLLVPAHVDQIDVPDAKVDRRTP